MDRAVSLERRRVALATELPFRLGGATIDPPAHEITWRDASRRLQPQTLKVLVALHDKSGEVVTRDELVERCWNGRVVGDDVVNRCISLLRRVAAESEAFQIDTVPRAGYRLVETPRDPSTAELPLRSGIFPQGKWLAAIAATIVVLGAGGVFAFEKMDRGRADAVMIKPFDVAGNAPLVRIFAAGVSDEIGSALSAAGVSTVHPGTSRRPKVTFVLRGRAELPGSDLNLTAELEDARDHAVLWSTSFTRPVSQVQAMQEQVAANLAAVLHCALDTSHQRRRRALDQDSIKLYLQACELEQSVDPPSSQIQSLLQQVTARQPGFAEGWARLALSAANAAWIAATPQQAGEMRREARMAALAALRIDPKSSVAYEALTDLDFGRVPFAQLQESFQKVLSLDPNNASAVNDEGDLLMRMGSLDEALQMYRRGVELDAISPAQVADLVTGLIDDSRDAEAQATLERALRIWPDDNHLRITHLDYEARFGDPDHALSILNDPGVRPHKIRDVTLEAYRRLAETRKSGQPAQRQRFIAWLKREVASGQLSPDFAAPHIAQFGDVNSAFRLALAAQGDVFENDPEFLWKPESLALRRDPRFIAVAQKFHVADFWRSTGKWPAFCSQTNWPYNCRIEDARLRSSRVK